MKLTRRGIAVVGIVVFAALQSYFFGERALNFVAAPGIAALFAGVFALWRAEKPSVERSAVRPGFPGEKRRETIAVEGSGIATVVDVLPDGIDGDALNRTVSLPTKLDRELSFRKRGVYPLGSVTVRQRDPLGLVATDLELGTESDVAVYPEVYQLDPGRVIGSLSGAGRGDPADAFDWLREYQHGDPLRRVHWKSSAKYDELLVADSGLEGQTDPIHLVVDGRATVADELAVAAASFALPILEAGLEVALTLPDDQVTGDSGQRQRERVLLALAATGDRSAWDRGGDRSQRSSNVRDDADVLLFGDEDAVTVRVDNMDVPFARLRSGSVSGGPGPRSTTTASAVIDG